MALELKIQDAPQQDLKRWDGYVYRIRIEDRPEISLEEAMHRRSIVDPRSIPFLEFDLPGYVVCPGCQEAWQKTMYVLELKKSPYESAIYLIAQGIRFGVLDQGTLGDWLIGQAKDGIRLPEKPRLKAN